MEKEIVDIDELKNIVNEIEEEDRTIKDLEKNFPNKIEKLEDALINYMGENNPKLLKMEFPDKWKYFTKNWLIHMNNLIVSMIVKNLLTN